LHLFLQALVLHHAALGGFDLGRHLIEYVGQFPELILGVQLDLAGKVPRVEGPDPVEDLLDRAVTMSDNNQMTRTLKMRATIKNWRRSEMDFATNRSRAVSSKAR
jgi:hypothetical protein